MLFVRSTFSISLLLFSVLLCKTFAQDIFNIPEDSHKDLQRGNQFVSNVQFYQLDFNKLNEKLNSSESVQISIPIGTKDKIIELQKVNILRPDYSLTTSSGIVLHNSSKFAFYHGKVSGSSSSKASLTKYNDGLTLSIYDEDGNYNITKEEDFYAGYYDLDRVEPSNKEWSCNAIEYTDSVSKNMSQERSSSSTPECVSIFLEIDHNMYNKHGGNLSNVENWAMTLFSQVAILYMEHEVPLNISGIQVWDTPDPYVSASNTSSALGLFRNSVHSNPNFNGRLAHLLSGRSLGGGIAYLNSLCSNFTNVAVSANLNSGNVPYPNYSWNVMVVAHEIGHNMGSPHTQSCSWNGNNTAIDGCGNIEGSCADPGNPPNNVGGTIMSYCHLTSSGINFNNGFGPQPGALINSRYINANCITGENCTYVPPFNDVCNRAKQIPVLNYCVNGYYENYATTSSGDGGPMSCGETGSEKDIWYSFVYPDVDTVQIEVQATDLINNLVVQIYQGSCETLSSIACGFSVNGEKVTLTLHDETLIQNELYIRVVEKGSDEEGEFSLCIYSQDLPCQDELSTLLDMYNNLNGDSWTNNTGWYDGAYNDSCDYCNWEGVKCGYLGQITELDLPNNNLQGNFPLELSTLIHLEKINLGHNNLTDTIHNFWDSLDHLIHLDLSFNNLSGQIPSSFGSAHRLNRVHLDHNSLDSIIPVGLGYNSSLRTFTATNNLLEGCFSNGLSPFCSRDSFDLTNNPGLPYNGDVTLLCEEGFGTDWDLDGYCNEVEDCDDFNSDVNPGSNEVLCDAIDNNCDGYIDEGSDHGPNVWVGPDTLGLFDLATNWSLGHLPKVCEDIEIGMDGDTIHLIILGLEPEGGQGNEGGSSGLKIRDLSIGANTTLLLKLYNSLDILGRGEILNNGQFNVLGYLNIRDQNDTNNTGILNNGVLNIGPEGGIYTNEIGDYGLVNTASGVLTLEGFSFLEAYQSEVAKNAILNSGNITLNGYLNIFGSFTEESIKNQDSGVINLGAGSSLNINN